jgi:Uma2 family endonuclease
VWQAASPPAILVVMNIALSRAMTVDDYLAWGNSQSERRRTELINGRIVAMTPERVELVEIKFAAALALKIAISRAKVGCHALGDGLTVRIDDHTAYEPDAMVYCGERLERGSLSVPNPVVIVEVLSPTTAHTDTSAKLIGYFKLPSVMHYLVIDPDARTVTHHRRKPAGGITASTASEGALQLDPPGIDLKIADLFG